MVWGFEDRQVERHTYGLTTIDVKLLSRQKKRNAHKKQKRTQKAETHDHANPRVALRLKTEIVMG